jgi:iron complex outermembrane receptor protein
MRSPFRFCGFLVAAGPGILAAQARPDTSVARLDPVAVTAARAPAAVGGASVLILRPGELPFPAPPAASLADLLREAPFVSIRQNSRGESEISMRGSESRQAAVLVEGVPVTLAWDGRVDASRLPLTGVRRITITRGLGSMVAGPNVLGGVIELGFGDGLAAERGRRDVTISTGIDGVGAYAVSLAAGTHYHSSAGLLSMRAGVSQRQRDGFALSSGGGSGDGLVGGTPDPGQDGEGRLRTNSDLSEFDGFASVRLTGGSGRFAGLTVTGFEAERGVPSELHVSNPRYWRYPEVSRLLLAGSLGTGVGRTPFGTGSLMAGLALSRGDLEIESYTDGSYRTIAQREFGAERTATLRVLGTHSLGAGGQVRASHTRSEVRYDEWFDDEAASRYRQRLQSSAVETEWSLSGGAQVAAGAALDRGETPESGGRHALGALTQAGWRAGASAPAFREAARLHVSLSRRARFPALRELYSGAINRFVPNPDLRPETLLAAEAGVTVSGGRLARAGVTLQAVGFRHQLDDAVVRITLPNRRFQRINRDELRSHGLELMVDWASLAHRTGGHGWTLATDLLLQRVRLFDRTVQPGPAEPERAEHMPELRASADLGAPLPARLRGHAGIRITGRQFCQHPDQGGLVPLGSQAVTHAALTRAWRASRWGMGTLRGILAVENLADATVYDQCGLPQPGRTVRVGLELR